MGIIAGKLGFKDALSKVLGTGVFYLIARRLEKTHMGVVFDVVVVCLFGITN
jgi:hypothetical protein